LDEIIYLEPDEEITSVIDKIKNATNVNLGLVIPRDATLLQSVVNLRLLSREANTLGKKISIVTADKIGRNLASQIGLPVFSSLEEKTPIYQSHAPVAPEDEVLEVEPEEANQKKGSAFKVQHYQTFQTGEASQIVNNRQAPLNSPAVPREESGSVAWNRNEKPVFKSRNKDTKSVGSILERKDKEFKSLHKILWPVIGVFVLLCFLATYLLLPKVTATVFVPSESLQKDLTLSVSGQVKVPSIENSVLPGTLIESESSKDGKFATTGKKDIGQKAKGTITIYNNLDSNSHSFAAGTQVSSSSKTFLIQNAVTIPGATVQNLKIVPGSASVAIEAQNPGAEYNVKAGRFTILGISAVQQDAIYGQTSADLTGGLSKVAQVVSQQDYDTAKDGLIKDITDTINKDIQQKAEGKRLLEKAILSSSPEITSTAKVNDEASDFQMTVKIKDQAVIFSNDDLSVYLNDALQKQVSSDKMVTIPTDADLILSVTETAYDKSQLDLTAKVNAKVSAKVSANDIQQQILGKKVSEAQSIILNQKGIDHVEINFNPSWWLKIIPNLKRGVIIKTEYISREQE